MKPRRMRSLKHLGAMAVIAAVLSLGLAFLFFRVNFIPNPASEQREAIDGFMRLQFGIAGIFFGVVVTVFTYALIFFRRRPGDNSDAEPTKGNGPLEVVWTLIPLTIVIGLGIYGAVLLEKMTAPPKSTALDQSELEVDVIAFRFGWIFEYPVEGVRAFELELPVDRPVVFHIESMDVVHSFWVREFGPKQDAVPGMTTALRITPTKTGDYSVECSQLCGSGHTLMVAPAHVVQPSEFQDWIKKQQTMPPKTVPATTPMSGH